MAAPGVTAGGTGTGTPAPSGGGTNPFWEVTNLFSQKNKLGNLSGYLLTTAGQTSAFAGPINSGNYLRGIRVQVRTTSAPAGAFTVPAGGNDFGMQLFQNLGMQNTDGAEILFDVINGFGHYTKQKYMRPFLQDPLVAYDYVAPGTNIGPSYTLFLETEVRQQLGCLENTDTRSQYTWTSNIAA